MSCRIPVEVVSDGFGFYIAPRSSTWVSAGSAGRPRRGPRSRTVARRSSTPTATRRASCAAPASAIACSRTGPRAGAVIFIGDGESDRYAAGYADVVFAKRSLVHICVDNGWPFHRWTEFAEIDGWFQTTVDAWRADGSLPAPVDRPFFCGPEVWGEGHWDPPAPNHGEGTVAG